MSKATVMSGRYLKLAFFAIFALALIAVPSSVDAKGKKPKYGTIKILSTPGGLPLSIDGKSYGVTSPEYRAIDLEPGLHNVAVTLPSGKLWTRAIDLPAGRIKCVALNYRPSLPPPTSPCPFPITISAPSQVSEGEIITYLSDVNYGGKGVLNYKWSITPSNANVISGAGTPTITVDSTGLGGQRIVTTLVVDDGSGDPTCRQTAQAVTTIPPVVKREIVGHEFDTCCSCSYDDQKARLDNLAVALQNDPSMTTYVFAYGGRTGQVGQADRLLTRSRDYLVTQRGIDSSRIVTVNGGFREQDCVEVWVVPQGAKPPQASPTVPAGDVRPAPPPKTKRKGRG